MISFQDRTFHLEIGKAKYNFVGLGLVEAGTKSSYWSYL